MKEEKKLYIVSLGCPKNLVDSEVMLGALAMAGFRVCERAMEADILLVNTCGFIRPAVEESIEEILTLARVKEENPDARLVVTGCLVQRYGEDLRKELPEVDLFIGADGFRDIVDHLGGLPESGRRPLDLAGPRYLMDAGTPRLVSTPPHRAYLKITEGCMNRCSYCLIPSIRGPLRSRLLDDLAEEAARLGDGGVKELTLIGQDITAYGLDMGKDGPRLADLLRRIVDACDIPWIRLLYLHPLRLSDEVLAVMAEHPRLLPYVDIPLQHVSTRILRLMNRPYDRAFVEKLLDRIRRLMPAAAIRTTFITGFPGEKDEDFWELEDFIQTERFRHVGAFAFCREEGAAAADLPDQCPEEVAVERRDRIMAIQRPISEEMNRRLVGRTVDVLVEGVSSETDLLLEGRAAHQAPDIDGCVHITSGRCNPGDIVTVRVTGAHPYDLVGGIIGSTEDREKGEPDPECMDSLIR